MKHPGKQYTYCDVTNDFVTIFLFSRGIYGATFLYVEFLTCFFRRSLCDLQKRNLSQKLYLVVHSYFQSCWCYCRFTYLQCHFLLSIYPEPYLGSSQTSVMEFFAKRFNVFRSVTIFVKKLHHRYLIVSQIQLRYLLERLRKIAFQ